MRQPLTRAQALHISALSVWLTALVVGAASAILGFRTMRQQEPTLPGFAGYEGEHWRLLAGYMADRVFLMVDAVGVVAVLVAGMTLAVGVARGLRIGRIGALVRAAAVLLSAAVLSANIFLVRPLLDQAVTEYREAAMAGDTTTALQKRDRYDQRHAIARSMMTGLAALVAVALIGAIAQAGRPAQKDEP
ncbi:MAG: hypothetical protein ACF8R7_06820 [Phycisphaerales bacterium JB039]